MQIDVPGKRRRSRGVPGSIFGLKPRKTGPKIFSPTPRVRSDGLVARSFNAFTKGASEILKEPRPADVAAGIPGNSRNSILLGT